MIFIDRFLVLCHFFSISWYVPPFELYRMCLSWPTPTKINENKDIAWCSRSVNTPICSKKWRTKPSPTRLAMNLNRPCSHGVCILRLARLRIRMLELVGQIDPHFHHFPQEKWSYISSTSPSQLVSTDICSMNHSSFSASRAQQGMSKYTWVGSGLYFSHLYPLQLWAMAQGQPRMAFKNLCLCWFQVLPNNLLRIYLSIGLCSKVCWCV